jgi:hypothetical protein
MFLKEDKLSPQELIDTLRKLESSIPDFAPLTNDERLAMRRVSTLNERWVEEAVNAVGASPRIATVVDSTYGELRDEIKDMMLWKQVEQQLRATLRGVEGANLVRRHRLNLKALQAYGVLRQLIRQPENRDLLPYYQTLKEMNKLGKRKKKEEAEPEAVTE